MSFEKAVADVLRDPKLDHVDFEVEKARITGERLRAVGLAIEQKRIQLVVETTGKLLSAAYSPHPNRMTLGSAQTLQSAVGKSGIVHESVHALVDLFRCKDLTELSDEVCAYLAESMYLRLIGAGVKGGSLEMAIYNEADKLVRKKGLLGKRGVKLVPADYAKLRDAIHDHPAYSGIDPHSMTSGHGVPEK